MYYIQSSAKKTYRLLKIYKKYIKYTDFSKLYFNYCTFCTKQNAEGQIHSMFHSIKALYGFKAIILTLEHNSGIGMV